MTISFDQLNQLLLHIQSVSSQLNNPDIERQYIGYAAVSCVTIFEVQIKNNLINFAHGQNIYFKNYVESKIKRLNGQIAIEKIKEYMGGFGSGVKSDFERRLELSKNNIVTTLGRDIVMSYNNLLTNRHTFVHTGNLTLSIQEVMHGFEDGKHIITIMNDTFSNIPQP